MHPDSSKTHNPDLMKPEHAAHALGVSVRTLAAWRNSGSHSLPYVKLGRLVRYRGCDLTDWLQANVRFGNKDAR